MEPKAALSYAIEALSKEIQKIAVDANLHDVMGANHAYTVRASQKRKQLVEARVYLETLMDQIKPQKPRTKNQQPR